MSLNQKDLEQGLAAYKKSRKRELLRMMLLSALGIAAFLVIWQLVVQFKLVNVRNLPAPSKVVETILYKISNKNPDGNTLGTNILASLQVALSGFILALVIGIPLGLFMGWFTPVDKFVRPVFELLRPVPPIAWIPVVVVFVGIDLKAKATIIFLSVFVPCVINSYTGIKLTKRTLINVAKTFGAGNFETFIKVGIPSAMPMVFTGVRTALGGAWSTLVAAEMLAAKAGLGYMLQVGRNVARADVVVAGMVTISVLGALMALVLGIIEKRVLKWKLER
ncbi:MAG: ABC transporter permease [Oscillospiraceae bacterium]|jgi:taurine transport system permease protein|nr:ABC transporter permease [Oscillospiraceae bacterium]